MWVKEVDIEDSKSVGLAEIVSACAKALNNDAEFDHIIEHALSCMLEKENGDVLSYGELRFGLIHEVIDAEHMGLH